MHRNLKKSCCKAARKLEAPGESRDRSRTLMRMMRMRGVLRRRFVLKGRVNGGGSLHYNFRHHVAPSCSSRGSNNNNNPTLYSVLGVKENSTQRDIRKAYRALAKTTHPDVTGGDPEEFKRVAKAYAVLSDENARAEYDRKRMAEQMFAGGSIDDAFDFFASSGYSKNQRGKGRRKEEKEEPFYGFADLFRDIEREFAEYGEGEGEAENGDGILRKLGEDLLDFLEGKPYAEAGDSKKDDAGPRPTRDPPKPKPRPKSRPAAAAASFDADLELQELKRQMGKE